MRQLRAEVAPPTLTLEQAGTRMATAITTVLWPKRRHRTGECRRCDEAIEGLRLVLRAWNEALAAHLESARAAATDHATRLAVEAPEDRAGARES